MNPLTVSEYIEKYHKGEKLESCNGLCARILKSKDEFTLLSDTPGKLLSWIFGEDGLMAVTGKRGWDLMRVVGHDEDWVNLKLKQGYKFKLAIFPSVDCVLADWEGMFKILESTYPHIWPMIAQWANELKTLSYDEIQDKFSDFNIKEVDLLGRSDPRFVTLTRFQSMQTPSLGQVRAFLYHEIGLTFLYSGQGHTVMEHSLEKGLSEYLTKNRSLLEIEHLQLIDIELEIKERAK